MAMSIMYEILRRLEKIQENRPWRGEERLFWPAEFASASAAVNPFVDVLLTFTPPPLPAQCDDGMNLW
jgi:hypothetical protein